MPGALVRPTYPHCGRSIKTLSSNNNYAPSITKYGFLVRPHAQIVALCTHCAKDPLFMHAYNQACASVAVAQEHGGTVCMLCCIPHCVQLCGVVWRGVLCCAVLCCAVLCCAVLCCAVLCCAVLCCAVLCHFVLRCGGWHS